MHKRTRILETFILATLLLTTSVGPLIAGEGSVHDKKGPSPDDSDPIYTVEGDVQKPQRTGGPVPAYPELAREEKIQGAVVARLLIEKTGTVSSAEIVEPLRDDFDANTLEAVSQWTFEPATLEGKAVRVNYDITVNYRLSDSKAAPSDD